MRSLASLFNKVPTPYVSENQSRSWRSMLNGMGQSDPARTLNAMSVSTLFAIVSANSTATASVEWKLYRKAATADARREVKAHPALSVWQKPNNFYTQTEFVESEQQHVDLTGEGWWVLYRDPRAPNLGPTEIWPVRPDRMFPVKHPTEFLTGYIYKGPSGEEIPLDINEVIQLRMPNPNDPYRGLGPVQALVTAMSGYQAALEYNRNFFLNNAEPGGIIEFPQELEDDEWRRHKRRWDSQHRGASRAHRVAILEGGAKWVDRKYTNRDMEFIGLANFGRDTMREAFGIHKFILGQSDDVNLAQALAADVVYAKKQTVPRLERFKSALNNDFLPMFPGSTNLYEFDYCSPVPGIPEEENAERESKASTYKTLIDAGVHPDDAAEIAGLPPMRTVSRTQEVNSEQQPNAATV